MKISQATIPIQETLQGKADAEGFGLITDLGQYASRAASAALTAAGLAAFAYLIYGGVMWIFSSGDKAKVDESKSRITNAIIGLGIVAASWAVFLLIEYFLGLNLTDGVSTP